MIIRTSPLIPEMRQGFFECTVCRNTVEIEVDRGRIEEPLLCQNCNVNHTFQLIHNRSFFMDKQIIKVQESPGLKFLFTLSIYLYTEAVKNYFR